MPAVLWGVVPEGQGQDMSEVRGAPLHTQFILLLVFKASCIIGSYLTSFEKFVREEACCAASVKAADNLFLFCDFNIEPRS